MQNENRLIFERKQYNSHLKDLENACDWLKIGKGRSLNYKKLITEFFEKSIR